MEIAQNSENSWTVYSAVFDYMATGKTEKEAYKHFEH